MRKQQINDELTKIVLNNNNILDNIIKYINSSFKCNNIDISNNTKFYITELFRNIKLLKYREIDLRNERKKLVDDLEDLKRAYVSGDNLSINETGKNTGAKINQVELRQIKMLELKEQLQSKLSESLLLEKSLNDNTKLFQEFIRLIPNPQHQEIIYRMYINCETASKIANDYYYSVGTINSYRNRGTDTLVKLIKIKLL